MNSVIKFPFLNRKNPQNIFIYIILIILICFLFSITSFTSYSLGATTILNKYSRIISTAPSISETFVSLQAEDTLVGISKYCSYLGEFNKKIKNKTIIGDYSNLYYEKIFKLNPDVIILTSDNEKFIKFQIDKLNKNHSSKNKIATITLNFSTITEILNSITMVGEITNKNKFAKDLAHNINHAIDKIKLNLPINKNRMKPSVLIIVGDVDFSLRSKGIYVAANNNLFNEMILISGGKNVIQNNNSAYIKISFEKLLKLNPDIIIDLDYHLIDLKDNDKINKLIATKKNIYAKLKHLNASNNNSLHFLFNDYSLIPGPRFIDTLKNIFNIIDAYKSKNTKLIKI
ncbi:MAG: ABC transporter substrate-binding protein [Oligoflexia bacterium]|nr:ABC transporter substrate-binding protein [Oligoflexia bacterium]